MVLLQIFILTFLIAALGVIPPGMLNLKIAQISVKQSQKSAILFIYGVIFVVFIQSFIAFNCSVYFNNHPEFVKNFKLIGCVLFFGLTIYFFGKGVQELFFKTTKIENSDKKAKSFFINGMFLSAINLFPIPFYVLLSLYFSSFIDSFFSIFNNIAFVLGATFGTGSIYFLYAKLFYKHQNKTKFFIKNINFIIGFITLLVGGYSFYKI